MTQQRASWCILYSICILMSGCSQDRPPPAVGTLERHRFEIAATAAEQIVAMPVREGPGRQAGRCGGATRRGSLAANRASVAAQAEPGAGIGSMSWRTARAPGNSRRHGAGGRGQGGARPERKGIPAARQICSARGLVAQAQVDVQLQLARQQRGRTEIGAGGARPVVAGYPQRAARPGARGARPPQRCCRSRMCARAADPARAGRRRRRRAAVPARRAPAAGRAGRRRARRRQPYARVYIPEPPRRRCAPGQRWPCTSTA